MAFSVDEFRSEVFARGGPLRTNKFLVTFSPPQALIGITPEATARSVEYWCESVLFPGFLLGTHDVRRYTYGPVEKRPWTPSFTQLQCMFVNDSKSDIWNYFNTWMQAIFPHELQNGINSTVPGDAARRVYELDYKQRYTTDINIIVFSNDGKPSVSFVAREAFPAQMPDVQLNWNEQNNILRFPVLFDYVDWYRNPTPPVTLPSQQP